MYFTLMTVDAMHVKYALAFSLLVKCALAI